MQFEAAVGWTVAAIGSLCMLVATWIAIDHVTALFVHAWWVTASALFAVGLVILFAGLYLRPLSRPPE